MTAEEKKIVEKAVAHGSTDTYREWCSMSSGEVELPQQNKHKLLQTIATIIGGIVMLLVIGFSLYLGGSYPYITLIVLLAALLIYYIMKWQDKE